MSKKQNIELSRDKTCKYSLYCCNFIGTGLKTIRNEFKSQVQTGLRQPVFIIDLQEIEENQSNEKNCRNSYLINHIKQQILGFCKDYETLTKKIEDELKFDLFQYWLKDIESKGKPETTKQQPTIKAKDTKPPSKRKDKSNKDLTKTYSSSLIPQKHNRVGQPITLAKRKYIKDEPTLGKLFILILGQMNEEFLTDLLRQNLPLEGILNFIPIESNYDIMLGNNKLRNFIEASLETISSCNYQLRQEVAQKPVGIFLHSLPVISICMTVKYARDIFDQLTWSIYDIDVLRQQYDLYYFKPFKVLDVGIPLDVNLTELYYEAETLSTEGHFQKLTIPISGCDWASVASYLNSLIKACSELEEFPSLEFSLRPKSSNNSFSRNQFQSRFSSIVKINKFDRIIVDGNNSLLLNMLQYSKIDKFETIYLCCLDYTILKPFTNFLAKHPNFPNINNFEDLTNFKSLILPKYLKQYFTVDSLTKRITELVQENDDYQVQEFFPGYRLYIFKKKFNVLKEHEKLAILPSRLCFRDFTLFQMEEFLQNLKTPQQNLQLSNDTYVSEKKVNALEIDENIFIRNTSLKAFMLQKEKSLTDDTRSRKSDTRSNKSKNKRNSSVISDIKEERYGLPPDHHLLKGYNLEDILQEVRVKTTLYNFRQGFVKLYEEKWCFQEMNKELALKFYETTFYFSRPRNLIKGLDNNIRLVLDNNITIRLLNQPEECSKIVINYPNGLSIFNHKNDCEQIWYNEPTPRNEERRIFTPYGAVIVYFKSNDLILIMRYNGEIYRLYQHEPLGEEEEHSVLSDLEGVQEKSTSNIDVKAQGDKSSTQTKARTTLNSKKLSQESSLHTNTSLADLKNSINFELEFLNFVCSLYNLKYVYMNMTTSHGKRFTIKYNAEISVNRSCSIEEWHDYFANESYCQRSDGVKMIWTSYYFKCYHADGSIFKTTIEEELPVKNENDEFELLISQSSSHDQSEEKEIDAVKLLVDREYENLVNNEVKFDELNSTFTIPENEIPLEYRIVDKGFAYYNCNCFVMQHPSYAEIYTLYSNFPNATYIMEIFGIGNISLYIQEEICDSSENIGQCNHKFSLEEGAEEDITPTKLMVNVSIDNKLFLRASENDCEIFVVLPKSEADEEENRDTLTLFLKYTDDIQEAFKYVVNKINSMTIENNDEQRCEKIYFIENYQGNQSIKGYEFLDALPQKSQYCLQTSNTIIELNPLKTINELMTNISEDRKEDLKKFPRFKRLQKKETRDFLNQFPHVLSANIYLEVPEKLRSLCNIPDFLEPLEKIKFKNIRQRFQNIIEYYIKAELEDNLKLFTSYKNWNQRNLEHQRRLFNEQQRLGLYQAMSRHKTYPNYWIFCKDYKGHVKHIEFFDFMKHKCKKMEEEGKSKGQGDG